MSNVIFPERAGNYRQTWVLATPFLVLAFFLLGQILALLPTKPTGIFTAENIETYPYFLYPLFVAFGMVGLLVIAWVRWFERRSLASIGLARVKGATSVYIRGFGVGLVCSTAVVILVYLFNGYSRETDSSLFTADLLPIGLLMLGFMVQSGVEEILFRGWMLSRIAARYGVWAGIIGNSLMFTVMHYQGSDMEMVTPLMLVNFYAMCFLFSVFLSLYVIRTGSVWGACAWHASWNWAFISWFGLPTTGISMDINPLVVDLMPVEGAPAWLTGGVMGPEDSVMVLLVLGVGCAILLFSKKKSVAV